MWITILHKGVIAYTAICADMEGYSHLTLEKERQWSEHGFILPTSNRTSAVKEFFQTGKMEYSVETFRLCAMVTHDDKLVIYNVSSMPVHATYFDLGIASSKVFDVQTGDLETRNAIRTALYLMDKEHNHPCETHEVLEMVTATIEKLSTLFPINPKHFQYTTVEEVIAILKDKEFTKPLIGCSTNAIKESESGVSRMLHTFSKDLPGDRK
jgi:hypothetical protein